MTGDDPHWVNLGGVCKHLQESQSPAMDAALKYASDAELLACGPLPVHSVMLTHKGVMLARGRLKRS
jgi:hypothetical protein